MALMARALTFFFSSRRRHTRYWRDWSFRRVLFRSLRGPLSRTGVDALQASDEALQIAGFDILRPSMGKALAPLPPRLLIDRRSGADQQAEPRVLVATDDKSFPTRHALHHRDLLQVCAAGQDWIDSRLNEAGGGAGGMAQGKEFKGRQFTAEVILWAV